MSLKIYKLSSEFSEYLNLVHKKIFLKGFENSNWTLALFKHKYHLYNWFMLSKVISKENQLKKLN